ncbi:MAG: 1-acyl-sn-glycerol-3-phosphate acyltransferase [Cyanobacteria bacterium]|nr:1-acyl-sn-glycerol-3-phosphate acyltransferase [Cyanobacteriota bacterium]
MKKIKDFFYALPRIIVVNLYNLIIRLKVFNYSRIPVNEQVIFAINHVTGADPIILMAALRKKIVFFAISNDFKTKFTNFFFRKVGNAVPVFQENFFKNFGSFKELMGIKGKKGINFAIFPEGKLNKTDIYDDFKKGAAYFAYKTKLKIIPVYMQGIRGLKAGTKLERNEVTEGIMALILNLFRKINIFVGNPIDPIAENIIKDFSDIGDKKNYKAIVERIHKEMQENFQDLQNEANEILLNNADKTVNRI